MPRDLTELMERATSAAPPETHHAADITHLAARRQRRRTSGVAAAVAAVVLVGAAGYGVTRGRDSAPEPARHYKYGQELKPSDVVPAESLPGYRAVPWTVPSVERLTDPHLSPLMTYLGVDAQGRLLVESVPSRQPNGSMTVALYDAPGGAPTMVRPPPSPVGGSGQPIRWIPSFGGDDRLIWRPDVYLQNANGGYRVTDLAGGHDMFLPAKTLNISGYGLHQLWVSGDTAWFLTLVRGDDSGTLYYDLSTTSVSHPRKPTIVAHDVLLADVDDGLAGWLTADGRVFTEDATGGAAHEVPVPFADGCRMPPGAELDVSKAFAVGPSMVALTERCGSGSSEADELVAFDPHGRLLMHLSGISAVSLSMGGSSLLFWAGEVGQDEIGLMHYDLATGVLSSLPFEEKQVSGPAPQAAGEYVLWYGRDGGHVARIPQ
jgi:hypothetical protein